MSKPRSALILAVALAVLTAGLAYYPPAVVLPLPANPLLPRVGAASSSVTVNVSKVYVFQSVNRTYTVPSAGSLVSIETLSGIVLATGVTNESGLAAFPITPGAYFIRVVARFSGVNVSAAIRVEVSGPTVVRVRFYSFKLVISRVELIDSDGDGSVGYGDVIKIVYSYPAPGVYRLSQVVLSGFDRGRNVVLEMNSLYEGGGFGDTFYSLFYIDKNVTDFQLCCLIMFAVYRVWWAVG